MRVCAGEEGEEGELICEDNMLCLPLNSFFSSQVPKLVVHHHKSVLLSFL